MKSRLRISTVFPVPVRPPRITQRLWSFFTDSSISKQVRPQSDWERSLSILKASVDWGLKTKTGIMVGLGEADREVLETMQEAADLGITIFNIGQYLQPTINHLQVQRFVHPDIFEMYREKGLKMGFRVIESGPLVRSSYHADEQVKRLSMTY